MDQRASHYPIGEQLESTNANSEAIVAAAERVLNDDRKGSKKSLFRRSDRVNSLMGVQIIGSGIYVPDLVVTNAQLESEYGFEPGWIEQRTGILERRYAAEGQATSHLCSEAARRVIAAADVDPQDIDLLVVGTFTPDFQCPSTACLVQEHLGLDSPAFDLQAACSGFVYALTTAAQYVATGNSNLALVIGGDVNTRIVDPTDQRTAPLFGDGAGAVLVTRGGPEQGLMCYQMGSDGSGGPMLGRMCGGTMHPSTDANLQSGGHYLHMDGRNVFKWAVQALTETIRLMLDRTGLGVDDVSLYLLHQANIRIINYAIEQLGIPEHKVVNNLQSYGNTSAASIPLALDEAHRAGRIQAGDILLMSGFGAGLTWGTGLFRW
ncbi:MAG: ketoacyl-ACP synthase III [Planctomycetota bacterium]|nr:ketoacyl-ACP synthase III [Planctomycetota bacterium]